MLLIYNLYLLTSGTWTNLWFLCYWLLILSFGSTVTNSQVTGLQLLCSCIFWLICYWLLVLCLFKKISSELFRYLFLNIYSCFQLWSALIFLFCFWWNLFTWDMFKIKFIIYYKIILNISHVNLICILIYQTINK